MIYVNSAGNQETTAEEMKPRTPIRKISTKRLKELSGNGILLHHNSTIRRKPCNAMNAERKYLALRNTPMLTDSDSVILLTCQTDKNAAKTNSGANFGKQRKPINKQSTKQKARLQKLAQVRERWWRNSQEKSVPLICGICDEEIRTREELASDHIEPGHGKSDEISNLQPAHNICNQIKGSQRNFKIVRGDRNWKLIHGML
jgi:hypothetical protein